MNERFDELLRLWQDGEASVDELRELESALRTDPLHRRALVGSVLTEVQLRGRFAQAPAIVRRPFWRTRTLEAAAALLVVGLSALAVGVLFLRPEEVAPKTALRPPVEESLRFTADSSTYGKLVAGTGFSLIAAAERVPGTVLRASLEEEDGTVAYSILVAREGRLREITLDAKTGKILEDEKEDHDPAKMLAAVTKPLTEAIRKALEAVPGAAVEAEFELKGDRVEVEVEILSQGKLVEVYVDGATGAILKVDSEKKKKKN